MTIERLSELAYYRTGGSCARIYLPESIDELTDAVREINKLSLPFFVLGGGTNSLVCDDDWPGAVIALARMQGLRTLDDQGSIFCEAGVDNSVFAKFAADEGLNGAGWMYRLPGQMGGTVRMNARCYGGEISQIVKRVTCVDPGGKIVVHEDTANIFRGYKDTSFMRTGEIVASVEIQLQPGDTSATQDLMKFCEDDRVMKGQFLFPSCGCVFKNDYTVGVPSGMLLEAAGVKTLTHGGAAVSPLHANFVFNKGASSRDILELSLKMREAVYSEFGVWLEYEMEVLGNIPADLAARIKEQRPHHPVDHNLNALREKFQARPVK
ncbi:UDP-N-acetylmuramate dehydrogenase [bacterium]|nr:UDP-N-acetylmuramate dehydrogenase [bacterium]